MLGGSLKVYGLAALLALAAGVWGYIQTLQAGHAETRAEHAEQRAADARQVVREATAANDQTLTRLDTLGQAIREQRVRLNALRESTRAITDHIRSAPDDGCLDRPVPDGLRQLPGAADGARAQRIQRTAHATAAPGA